MSDLLDRMRKAVTAPLKIPGLTGEKEVQLVNDACLKSLEEMVRADERERCIRIGNNNIIALKEVDNCNATEIAINTILDYINLIKKEELLIPSKSCEIENRDLSDLNPDRKSIIEAIRKAEGG